MNSLSKNILSRLEVLESREDIKNFYWIKELHTASNPYIRIALEKASEYNVQAVYFRNFDDNRPPIPQIYIYDNTNKPFQKQKLSDNHHRIWSSCQVPLIYIFTDTELKIINAFEAPGYKNNQHISHDFETFELVKLFESIDNKIKGRQGKIFADFTVKNFDNGSFWENENFKKDFIVSKNAYESLIKKLKEIRKKILKEKLFDDEKLANKLLVMSILVKYLEERKDDKENSVFPKKGDERLKIDRTGKQLYNENFFHYYDIGAEEFIQVFKNNKGIIQLFRDLSKHFNGEIFRLNNEEENKIINANLNRFAEFLEAKTENEGQRVLWKLYSFRDLPIELISNIYESLVVEKKQKTDGVVYTPPFLVNFLLDQSMPLTDTNTNYTILDPACGSGIFLVQAYKRLIYRWKIKNNWKPPKINDLKKLLSNNIFGIDIEEEAIRVTAFSLTLALCDELSPREIWDDLQFDDLKQNNLFNCDFFELVEKKVFNKKVNLVIGNPPFEITQTPSFYNVIKKWEVENKIKIPDKNSALTFLCEAIKFCEQNAKLCLILPSSPFLYNFRSLDFRKHILRNYKTEFIVDFTHLSRFLFGSAKGDHPTLALFIENSPADEEDLLHLTIRRTKSIKEKSWFELDKYDFHYVPMKIALSNKKVDRLIWKSNFLGGGRIISLLQKIVSINKTFGIFLNEKTKTGWVIREGYKIGNSPKNIANYKYETLRLDYFQEKNKDNLILDEKQEFDLLNKKYSEAPFLLDKNTLDKDGLTINGINEDKISKLKNIKYFYKEWIKRPEIFEPPHLLMREVASNEGILIDYSDKYLSFPSQIIGIHAPLKDRNELKQVYEKIKRNEKFLALSLIMQTVRGLIGRSTSILKGDIDNLPFPDDEGELSLTKFELILADDILNIFLPYRRQHAKTTEAEIDVTTKPDYLNQFADVFLQVINSVYKEYRAAKWISTENHIIFPFYWGDKTKLKSNAIELEKHLNNLLKLDKPTANLRFIRVLTIYDQNVIYLIKPKQYRYWLRSIAIRDADEIFAYLVQQEYNL